jgi:hypothetical protein
MDINTFLELQHKARNKTTLDIPGVGRTVIRTVKPIERLIKSGSFSSTISLELLNETERRIRIQEMIEDESEILERMQHATSDEITVVLGIAGPYSVRLDTEPPNGEMQFSISEWIALAGLEALRSTAQAIQALGSPAGLLGMIGTVSDEQKEKIKNGLTRAGMLQETCGIRASTLLNGSEFDFETDVFAHELWIKAKNDARALNGQDRDHELSNDARGMK